MPFVLPDLPYSEDAFIPHVSAETFAYHHGKHHKAYVDKTNELVEDQGLTGHSLLKIIQTADEGPLFHNAAQLWNHSFFWQCLSPTPQNPSGLLADRIARDFGSTDALIDELSSEAVAHFASGWAWLVLDGETVKVTSYHDADTPIAHGVVPLFTLDVWEHAYYIDHRNARPKYIEAILKNCVNWAFVGDNLDGQGASRADQSG